MTQETFFQVLKSLPNFRGECSLLTWLCQIAKNVWYQHLRKGSKHSKATVEMDGELIFQGLSTEEGYILRESKISLYQNIRLLDNQMKEVVYVYLQNMNLDELHMEDVFLPTYFEEDNSEVYRNGKVNEKHMDVNSTDYIELY